MKPEERIGFLFEKYIRKECTPQELEELIIWMEGVGEAESGDLSGPLLELWNEAKEGKLVSSADRVDWDRVYDHVMESDRKGSHALSSRLGHTRRRWIRIAAAAIVTGIVFLGGGYLLLSRITSPGAPQSAGSFLRLPKDITPGGNKAVLTLANGDRISLDSAQNGVIAQQGSAKVIKSDSGQLSYTASGSNGLTVPSGGNRGSQAISYNTVSTPRAAQYQLTLSDGTRVWLNAASSLRFPAVFGDKERTVELMGEGYFEVAQDEARPFRVSVDGIRVDVLGTHFDVMAYADEAAIETTLLEGSVKVSAGSKTCQLQPGKQADLNRKNDSLSVAVGNAKKAIAWKNGFFYFDKSGVREILRQVSRWYDLDIVYDAAPSDMLFSGKIERNLPLSAISILLEGGQIHFRIEGKKLIVTQ